MKYRISLPERPGRAGNEKPGSNFSPDFLISDSLFLIPYFLFRQGSN
jgi:hypothetical protein